MLTLKVGGIESFDEESNSFVRVDAITVRLEHSLAAISKWESKYEKPFMGADERTREEVYEYVRDMSVDGGLDDSLLSQLTEEHFNQIKGYIESKRTATFFHEPPNASKSQKVVTSELIYSWMVSLQIPFECQFWHVNRLITLIKVLQIENDPKKKKMSNREWSAKQRALNASRLSNGGHG